ncbi:MAG: PQQ-binding-like beta-propeller repeat protein [Gemmatimonadota bacterium]
MGYRDRVGCRVPLFSLTFWICAALAGCAPGDRADREPPRLAGDWSSYAADKASTKYTPLDGITAENFGDLEIAWEWETADQPILDADTTLWTGRYEATPLAIDGILYTTTSLSQAVAIDGATGETLWSYDPGSWRAGLPPNVGFVHRGLTFWEGKDGTRRLFYGTGDAHLIALDPETGTPAPEFGENGRIDLTLGLRRPIQREEYAVTSPPMICRDVLIVGSSVFDLTTDSLPPPGDVRGIDVRSGERRWTFESIPQGELVADESWGDGSWRRYGNANVWTFMSCDEELGMVYLPFSTPSSDYYGGGRPGDNLYAESVVAVRAETGEKVWHFQGVHHGIWDYDFPAAPVLVDLTVDGRPIKALAQVSKQAFTYVLDRETGQPVWPIEERPVPQEPTVPGERLSPTQPFPTRPAAFDYQGVLDEDLIDFTPGLRAEAEEILKQWDRGPLFTPLSERGTLTMPGFIGGASWAGAAVDPATGVLYVPSVTLPTLLWLQEPSGPSAYPYEVGFDANPRGPQGLPFVKPPYGRVTAIDLNTGEHLWRTPMGKGPRDHPTLAGLDLPDLGWPFRTFEVRTPSLLLAAQEGPFSIRGLSPRGNSIYLDTEDQEPSLRALDPATGEIVGEIPLPGNASAGFLTYEAGGVQYVAIPLGGASQPARIVGLRLRGAVGAESRPSADRENQQAPDRVGEVSFPVSCAPEVQANFDRAVALLHSFEFEESRGVFRSIGDRDPGCAMAHWGVAMTYYHPLWAPPTPEELEGGTAAVERAREPEATARERDYVEAIGAFYRDHGRLDHRTRAIAYERGMDGVRERNPEDPEAEILYYLAVLSNADPTDATYAVQRRTGAAFERMLEERPNHPGLVHYIIHSYDYPPLASRAVEAAHRYLEIAPSLPHAVHMSSHIFTQVGMWDASIAANTNSATSAPVRGERLGTRAQAQLAEMHALDYLVYAYLQRAEDAKAREVVEHIASLKDLNWANGVVAFNAGAVPVRYALERRRWEEAAELPPPTEAEEAGGNYQTRGIIAVRYWARAVGAARSGRLAQAERDLARLEAAAAELARDPQIWARNTGEVLRLQATAWLALARGEPERALETLRSAAVLEDQTDKSSLSPGRVLPVHEQLGDLLLELGRPEEAIREYETSLEHATGRFRSYYGAATAARTAGRPQVARAYYEKLVELAGAGAPRQELKEAREFLASDEAR